MNIKELDLKKYPNLSRYKKMYFTGNENLLNNKILTIVGSRKMSSYGKSVVEYVVKSLASTNVATCSGFVDGVDMACFNYSHQCGVPTIICLGYGFDFFFKNTKDERIHNSIINNNLLVLSQFEPELSPSLWTYPRRDELLSSVSSAVLVIEASIKSGTEYTVKQAIKEKKSIYVTPGNIFSFVSKGTNNFLKIYKRETQIFTTNSDIKEIFSAPQNSENSEIGLFNTEETKIINFIRGNNVYFDDISKELKIDSSELSSLLSLMEIKGFVKKDTYGKYSAT